MTILPYHAIQPYHPFHAYDHLYSLPYHTMPMTIHTMHYQRQKLLKASLPLPRMPSLGSAPVSALSYIDHVADYMHTNQRLQDVPSPRQFPTEVPMYLPIKGWSGAKLGIKSVRIKVHFKTTSKRQTHHSDSFLSFACFYFSDFGILVHFDLL